MADSLRAARGQRARGNSRASNQRTPSFYDEQPQYLQPGAAYTARHSLRSVTSRFSLNEGFAATRSVYDFGFDEASSILERATLASVDARDDKLQLDALALGDDGISAEDMLMADLLRRTYHELLCLTADQSSDPAQVRSAYFRLFGLLRSEKLSGQSRNLASAYFGAVQEAFETLIEPSRRLAYELRLEDLELADDDDSSVVVGRSKEAADHARNAALQLLRSHQQELLPESELGIRLDASNFFDRSRHRDALNLHVAEPLDFSLSHSMSVTIPKLGLLGEKGLHSMQKVLGNTSSSQGMLVRSTPPTFSISASSYGILRDLASIPVMLLADRYQPLLPEIIPRGRMPQLAASRPSPLVTARFRQELFWSRTETPSSGQTCNELRAPDTVVELEATVLPEPTVTARVSNTLHVEGTDEPVHIEMMVSKPAQTRLGGAPRLGLALHRRIGKGNAFLCADSGDWSLGSAEETCRFFDEFSKFRKRVSMSDLPLRVAPTVEVGFNFSPQELGLRTGQALTRPADRGIKGLERDIDVGTDSGTWTVSAAVSSSSLAGYVRYGCDVPSTRPKSSTGALRVEAELCTTATVLPFSEGYLALRALSRITSLSKVGLELGITPHNLHLSLYWSRANQQRIRLPFLLATSSTAPSLFAPRTLFWAAVLPLAAVAGLDLLSTYRRVESHGNGKPRLVDLSKDRLADLVSRRRSEADELTALLATAVEPRQAVEMACGGLVILSAKYGVKDAGGGWSPDEEVADVTVAVAALVISAEEVDEAGGKLESKMPQLLIPAGLRKSKIIGFWDPAPLRTKALVVRYQWRGKEDVVEVSGREELRLP